MFKTIGKVGKRIPVVNVVGETIYNTGDNMRRHFGLQIVQSVKLAFVGLFNMIISISTAIKNKETHPGLFNEYVDGNITLKRMKEMGRSSIFYHFISSLVFALIFAAMVVDLILSFKVVLILYYSIPLIIIFPIMLFNWNEYMRVITGINSAPVVYLACMLKAKQYRYLIPSEKILAQSLKEFKESKKLLI